MPELAIDPGRLNRRLVLQRHQTVVQHGGSHDPNAFAVVGTYWASVEPFRGEELMAARQVQATTTHRITMRNIGPVLPTDRLVEEADPTRAFDIQSVYRADDQNAYLVIEATERTVGT